MVDERPARTAHSKNFAVYAVTGALSLIVVGAMLAMVVPRFEATFTGMGLGSEDLPASTALLFATSRWFRRLWFLTLPVPILFGWLAWRVPPRWRWVAHAGLVLVLGAIAAFLVVSLYAVQMAVWRQMETL